MIRRRPTQLSIWIGVVVGIGIGIGIVADVVTADVGGIVFGIVGIVVGVVGVVGVALLNAQGRGHSVRVRRPRSSGLPGGVGWLGVSLGGTMRRLLQACTSVDRLVDYLLDRTVEKLPAAASARFAEEWQDHREHYSGWRLVWWALCVRAMAMRTVAALGSARLPRDS